MMQTPGVSVIIVSYNAFDYLDKCLSSLLRQQGIDLEIIVVDNNSPDGTAKLVKEKYPSIKLIASEKNLGFSGGNNLGIKEATKDVLLLLNPDTELLQADTLAKMSTYLLSNPNYGIVAPYLLNTDGSFQSSFWDLPQVRDVLTELVYLHRIHKKAPPTQPTQVPAVSGAAQFLTRELALKLNGLDPDMFWMEDTDLCYRVNQVGKKIMFYPEVKVIHHGGKSSVDKYSISIPNQIMSKVKYFKKHGSWLTFITSDVLSFFFIISRLIIFAVLSLSINRMFKLKTKAYFVALKRFFSYNFAGKKAIIS